MLKNNERLRLICIRFCFCFPTLFLIPLNAGSLGINEGMWLLGHLYKVLKLEKGINANALQVEINNRLMDAFLAQATEEGNFRCRICWKMDLKYKLKHMSIQHPGTHENLRKLCMESLPVRIDDDIQGVGESERSLFSKLNQVINKGREEYTSCEAQLLGLERVAGRPL